MLLIFRIDFFSTSASRTYHIKDFYIETLDALSSIAINYFDSRCKFHGNGH